MLIRNIRLIYLKMKSNKRVIIIGGKGIGKVVSNELKKISSNVISCSRKIIDNKY